MDQHCLTPRSDTVQQMANLFIQRRSDLSQGKITLQLANYGFISPCHDVELYSHDIIGNTTSSEENVKI
jgi:hypothetical protein